MESPKTIPRSVSPETCSNYQELLRRGIDDCQKLGSDLWTDYNLHDPGVTILQQLCYALTDLGYRTDFGVADILAEDRRPKPLEQALFTGDRVLTGSPVTTKDYREFLYDQIDGVKNAWLVMREDHPLGVRGIYEVLVETREDVAESAVAGVLDKVWKCVRSTRSLGEDVDGIRRLRPQPIRVEAAIEIRPQADPSNVLAQALFGIQKSLSPFPRVQIFDELFGQHTPDQIWNGPRLQLGALDPQSLNDLRKSIHEQEIAHILLQTPDVKRVKRVRIGTVDEHGKFKNPEELKTKTITIEDGCVPRLSPSILDPQSSYSIDVELEGGFKGRIDARAVSVRIQELEAQMRNNIAYALLSLVSSSYTKVPTGKFRNIGEYFSLQHQFPVAYGLSKYGAGGNLIEGLELASGMGERQARLRQLKAYLLFFEQPIADYLAQLSHLPDLFSLDGTVSQSYFSQPLAHDPPRASDPEKIADVLLQQRRNLARAAEHYVVRVVDSTGEIIFVTPRLASYAEAEDMRSQILESGQNSENYRTTAIAANRVQLALHNAAGRFLALGYERFASLPAARAGAMRWSSFMRERADGPQSESPVKILAREDLGLEIINESSEIVLVSRQIYTRQDREKRLGEILDCGIDRRNYRIRGVGASGFGVDLHNASGASIAEGTARFVTEADAEEGIEALGALLRSMKNDEAFRNRHVLHAGEAAKHEDNPVRSYQKSLTRLTHQQDHDPLSRRNKILNHLLARFGERFDDDILERLDIRPFGEKDDFFRELVRWKIEFLRNYVQRDGNSVALGGGRGLGFDYGEADAPSGLECRVAMLLGLHGHDDGGQYSLQRRGTGAPTFSYYTKQVWPLKPEPPSHEGGEQFNVSRYRIVGPRPKDEPNLNDLHHHFVFSSEDSSLVSQLLGTGLNRKNYRIQEMGSEYGLLFLTSQGEAIEIHRDHTRSEAEHSLSALLRYLHDLNQSAARYDAGECMHVVEHVLLRPHGQAGTSGIHLAGPEPAIQLRSVPVARSKKAQHLKLMLERGRFEANYRVELHSSGRHIVILLDVLDGTPAGVPSGEKRRIATSHRTFDTEKDARAAIAPMAAMARSLHQKPELEEQVRTVPADDFYSHRISVFLPNWPARFQSDEFKLYAEQLIAENTPAHLDVSCFWLTLPEMEAFEKLLKEWKSLKRAAQNEEESSDTQAASGKSGALNEAAARLKRMIEELQEQGKPQVQQGDQRKPSPHKASSDSVGGETTQP